MNNTLLIHIGMPKTGTTALQHFLLDNTDILEKNGWSYPIIEGYPTGSKEYSIIENGGNGFYIHYACIRNDKTEWDKEMEAVLSCLENKNVILSCEGIANYEADKFIASVKERYGNVKVVIYLRRQDRAMESLYNEFVKHDNESTEFEVFIDSHFEAKQYVEYLLKLNAISQIIGKKNLIVRIYEKQQLIRGDIVADFLSVLGITLEEKDYEKRELINSSIGGNYFEIKRLINSVQGVSGIFANEDGSWGDRDLQTDFYDVCRGLSQAFNGGSSEKGYFTADKRKEFLRKFALENEHIAREYLQRDDGILFYDTKMDYPMYAVNQHSDFEADMIRLFTAALYAQNRRVMSLYARKLKEISTKLMMRDVFHKRGERALLFFGAGYNCQRMLDIVGNIPNALIVDNDMAKRGTVLNGIQVVYAKDIINWKEYFVIVTCAKTEDIEKQLREIGLQKSEDYILAKEYAL